MKNWLILLLLCFASVTFGASAPTKHLPNSVEIGDGLGTDKTLLFDAGLGASNPSLIYDFGNSKLDVNKDLNVGLNELKLGTGHLKYDSGLAKLVFSHDGILEKKIGSGSGSGSGGVNVLINGGAEDGTGNWTNSGGTFTQQSYTNSTEDNTKFFRFVATASGQYVETDLTTFPDFIAGGCMADVKYIQGDNVFILKVIDQVPAEISTGNLADLTDWLKGPTQSLDCPTQGKLRIESTAAGTIDFDDAYLGSNKNINPVGKSAHFVGSLQWQSTTGCAWLSAATSWSGFAADAQCDDLIRSAVGNVTSNLTVDGGDGQYPEIKIGNIKKGHIRVVSTGAYYKDNAPATNGCSYRFSDGTSTTNGNYQTGNTTSATSDGQIIGEFDYSSDQGELTYSIQVYSESGANCHVFSETAFRTLKISVYHFPNDNETQEAFTPEQADFFIDVSIGGADPIMGTSVPSHPSLDMVLNKGSAKITCSGSNPSTGLTCAAGSEQVGLEFNAPVSGKYKACFQTYIDSISSDAYWRLVYTQNSSDTEIQEGKTIGAHETNSGSIERSAFRTCAFFDVSSTGPTSFKFKSKVNSGSPKIIADRNGVTLLRDINITVELVSHNVSRPIIQNMVDTSVGSGARMESCAILNTGTPTTNNSLCDSWVDSFTDNGVGDIDINFKAGIWSEIPVCTNAMNSSGVGFGVNLFNTTLTEVRLRTFSQVPTLIDEKVNITCIGAR